MPLPDFTEEERAEVIQAIRAAIDGDRHVLSPRVRRLKSALAKLAPASAERIVTPLPPPKPSGTPSLAYQRLKGWSEEALARRQPQPHRRPRLSGQDR